MNQEIGKLFVWLEADFAWLKKQLVDLEWKVESQGKKLWKWFSSWFWLWLWSLSSVIARAWIVAFWQDIIKTTAEFSKIISTVQAVSWATVEEIGRLEAKAKELWKTTEFSATQAWEWLVYLATAWLSVEQQLKAIWPALNLATAWNITLAESADIATNIMSQFWKSVEELPMVMDVLSKTAATSNVNIQQISESMKYIWPTAKAMGISIEETSATIWVLGNNWLQWSIATRALGTSLTRLAAPTDKMMSLMEQLWISFFDSKWDFIGLNETVRVLEESFKDMTQEQQQWTLATLFGAEAIQEWIILTWTWADKLDEYTAQLKDSRWETDKMANTMRNNLAWSIDNTTSAFEWLKIQLGQSTTPILRWFLDSILTPLINWLTKVAGGIDELLPFLTILGTYFVWLKISWFITSLWTLTKALRTARTAVLAVNASLLANPVVAVISLIAWLYVAYQTNFLWIKDIIDNAWKRFAMWADSAKQTFDKVIWFLTGFWQYLKDSFTSGFQAIIGFYKWFFDYIYTSFTEFGETMYNLGSNIIKSLADGIKAKFEQVKSNLASIRDKIASFFWFWWQEVKWARAVGWAVSWWSPYLVWERGPEVFIPRWSWQIVPNNTTNNFNMGGFTTMQNASEFANELQRRLSWLKI